MPSLNKQSLSWFWQPSYRLSWVALVVLTLACIAVLLAAISGWLKLSILTVLVAQAIWQGVHMLHAELPDKRTGVRLTAQGWQLWNAQAGWQRVQLGAGSIALPTLVLLRYKHPRQLFYRSAVIAADSLTHDEHRQLRVRLKFSRQPCLAVR